MKYFNTVIFVFLSFSLNAFEFKGIESGMTREQVAEITGVDGNLDKQEAENWLNKTGYSIGISEGVTFEYTHDKKLYEMIIDFTPPNMFLRGKARDGGRDLFYSQVCSEVEVITRRYDNSQYIQCSILDEKELQRSIEYYRDEYENLVLSN